MQNRVTYKGSSWTRVAGCGLIAAALVACGAEGEEGRRTGVGSGGSGSNGQNGGGNGATGNGALPPPPPGGKSNDPRDLPVREKVCDGAGNCTCLRLALLGTLESAADDTDTQPFVDWLNNNSDGTATVTMVTTKPTLDEAWLAQYDILLLANVRNWVFSDAEKAAVENWVRTTGGGIVTLTGFVSDAGEEVASSQLISFAGFQYTSTWTAPETGQTTPLYYGDDRTTNRKECLSRANLPAGATDPIITTSVPIIPQTDTLETITFEVDFVGAFIGWGVNGPAGSTVIATDPVSGQNMAVAHEVDGTGRIFAWGDEWIIFRNQWEARGTPHNQNQDQYNICYEMPNGEHGGFFHSVQTLYQTKQFWYNIINWVAPPNECNFVVEDPDVIIR